MPRRGYKEESGGGLSIPVIDKLNATYNGKRKLILENWYDDGYIYLLVEQQTTVTVNKTLVVCDRYDILATLNITTKDPTRVYGMQVYKGYICFLHNNSDRGYYFNSYKFNPATNTITNVCSNISTGRNWPANGVTYGFTRNNIDYVCMVTNNTRYLTSVIRCDNGSCSATESDTRLYIQWFKSNYSDSSKPYLGFWGTPTNARTYGFMTTWEIHKDSLITGAKNNNTGTLISNSIDASTLYLGATYAFPCYDDFSKMLFYNHKNVDNSYQFIVSNDYTTITPQQLDWSSITNLYSAAIGLLFLSDGSVYYEKTATEDYDIGYQKAFISPSTLTTV